MSLVLYSYFRSSASFRVRIALNLKGLDYTVQPVHLLKNGGDQHQPEYLSLNPQGLVPVLLHGDVLLSQSSAIIEYLEEMFPSPALLPGNAAHRAYVRSIVQVIACEIHPLNNLRVLNYLKAAVDDDKTQAGWYGHWIKEGFTALEELFEQHHCNGDFCFGDKPGIADAFLVPQVFNALRYTCKLNSFPLISNVYENCMQRREFIDAAPENQVDAE
jgi:maleylacetoacetate isomerase